jgi:exodeoxyribonuclease VII large subunit
VWPETTEIELSVSQFVDLLNQNLEYSFPSVTISGELANFRVSKNRWVYFDLKDEDASVKFFASVYKLPGPLEDGMMLQVRGQPHLHNLYGFSVNVISMQPTGEGSLRRAADLLRAKLEAEGLFDPSRKRLLPYPPSSVGLITSKQSAAYADFIKIINARWQGVEIKLIDVQVQGEIAPSQIVGALNQFNAMATPPEILVLIRGGGSADDLAAFSTEVVTRAIAGSRVPTLVAIGHEVDISLGELAADQRASTPSNAAELIVPDRRDVIEGLRASRAQLHQYSVHHILIANSELKQQVTGLENALDHILRQALNQLNGYKQLITVLNPESILRRGYSIVRINQQVVRSVKLLKKNSLLNITLSDGQFSAVVDDIKEG